MSGSGKIAPTKYVASSCVRIEGGNCARSARNRPSPGRSSGSDGAARVFRIGVRETSNRVPCRRGRLARYRRYLGGRERLGHLRVGEGLLHRRGRLEELTRDVVALRHRDRVGLHRARALVLCHHCVRSFVCLFVGSGSGRREARARGGGGRQRDCHHEWRCVRRGVKEEWIKGADRTFVFHRRSAIGQELVSLLRRIDARLRGRRSGLSEVVRGVVRS